MSVPRVSVLIPAHNEERHLARTLAALAAQTLPPEEFEILVLSDRSTDRTVELAGSFVAQLPLRVLELDSGSVAEVRNRGAALAGAPVLAFLDADCEPRPEFLARGLSLATPAMLWGADYLIPPDATRTGRLWTEFQATAHDGPTAFLPAGTLWVHAADFARTGGFDPRLETSEDVEFCARARQQHGYSVIAYPELAVYHHGTPRTLRAFFQQNRWHGKHVLRAFLARPSVKTGALLALSGWTLLATLLTLAALAVAVWHPGLLLLALGLLLLPPLVLALARAVPRRRVGAVAGLTTLYLVYLLARAAALVHRPNRGVRA